MQTQLSPIVYDSKCFISSYYSQIMHIEMIKSITFFKYTVYKSFPIDTHRYRSFIYGFRNEYLLS